MIDYFSSDMPTFWFCLGFALLILEVSVLGLATGVILFSGIGALITGGLMMIEGYPQTWVSGIATFGISSALSTALLWMPLKALQGGARPTKDNSSDLIGYTFWIETDLTRTHLGKTHYSGIAWQVVIADEYPQDLIPASTRVEVTSVDAGLFRVKPYQG